VCGGGRSCFSAIYCPQKEIVKLHLTVSFFVLYCGWHIHFEIWIAVLKRRNVLEVIASNGRVGLKCILKKWFLNMWTTLL
jgi:hypothetical protein